MKKFTLVIVMILLAILVVSLTACDEFGANHGTNGDVTGDGDGGAVVPNPEEYKVTIHPNNGQANVDWKVTDPIPVFTYEGHTIEGFYLDGECTISVSLTSLQITGLTGNIDVYIKWKEGCAHEVTTIQGTPATCTEDGLTDGKYCSRCETMLVEQEVIPAKHTPAQAMIENMNQATCTEVGSFDKVVYCIECGHEISREHKTIESSHKIVEHEGQEETCTEDGWKPYETCSKCEYTTYETIPAQHKIVEHDAQEPTCTEIGWDAYVTCARCDYSTYNEIPATGHSHTAVVTDPTCTEQGYTTHTCHCGDSYVDTYVDALGHDEIEHDAQEQTCTEVGWDAYATCSRCDYSTYKENPATGHTWGDWYEAQAPTLTEFGEERRDCENCDCYETKECSITIVFYHTMMQIQREILEKYIAEFNKIYPNITVVHEQVGGIDDVKNQINADLMTGNQPNIAYCYPQHVAGYNKKDAVVQLNVFIDSMDLDGFGGILGLTQSQKDDFIADFYNAGMQFKDGGMYTLPMLKATEVLYYNKTFFEEHGLSVPTTWDEMELLCERIKQIDPLCIPLGYDSESNWFITMCEQYGSPYMSVESPDQILFDNSTNHAFVKKFREWYQKGYITTQEIYGSYTSNLFISASDTRCYMSIGSSAGARWQTPNNYRFEVGIASIPQVDPNNPKVVSQGPDLCILKNDDQQEVLASWLFVKFLTTNADFQSELSIETGYMPVIKSVTQTDAFINYLASADGGVHISALASKVCLEQQVSYFTPNMGFVVSDKIREIVGEIMVSALTEDVPTDLTIDEFIDQIFKAYSIDNGFLIRTSRQEKEIICYFGDDTVVEIPNGVTSIGDYAFYGCGSLTSIVIPNSVTSIGLHAFYNCTSLTSVVIPNSVTTIGDGAFEGCTSLTSVVIPNSVTTIGSYAFRDCDSLTYNAYDNGKYLGNESNPYLVLVEATSTSITSCEINENCKVICDSAFEGCTSLTSVVIPNSVTTIGKGAFYGCTSLTSIVIPDSVTTIGGWAFEGCTSLTSIYYSGTESEWTAISIGSNNTTLTSAARYYYCACIHDNSHWRYDSDGNISTEMTVGDWIVDVEATCTTSGSKHATCSVCGETVTVEIPTTDHSCGDDGVCTACGEEIPYTITNDATYAFVEIDGILQSTNHDDGSSSSYVITANTTITITFEYNVSSEASWDKFYINHNSIKEVEGSGTSNSYTRYSITLNAGDTLTFKYTKDSSTSRGDDCCYIKNLTITTANN